MRKVIKNGTTIINGHYVIECNHIRRIMIRDYDGILHISLSSNNRNEKLGINHIEYNANLNVKIGKVVYGKMEFDCEELIVEIVEHKNKEDT